MADPDRALLIDWLRLARSETVGPVTFAELIRRYGGPARALAAIPDLARRGGRAVSPKVATVGEAEAELAAGEALGARLLITLGADFPPLLAAIDPPPPLIWARGDLSLLKRPGVAIVGARIASAAGQSFARTLARQVSEAGYPVISGMARGVDGAAHEGALAVEPQ